MVELVNSELPADQTPINVGEGWENPVAGERLAILERPWDNSEGRLTFEMVALLEARVAGNTSIPLWWSNSP